MYADTFLLIERGHLLRLGIWAGISVIVGALMLLLVTRRATNVGFLQHFAIQLLAWGLVDLAIVAWGWQSLAYRDYASAMELQQFLWLNVGLDAGYAAVGLTLAITGWMLGKRLGLVGAGVAVVVQGLALLVLDIRFLTIIGSARVALAAPITGGAWIAS